VDLVQQELDMLANDLFNLKPGTFIKGLSLEADQRWFGRVAHLNIEGWRGEMADGMDQIRTPLFLCASSQPTLTGLAATELIKTPKFLETLKHEDPEEAFSHVEWIGFNYNDPIGVHLNEFALYSTHEGNYILLYTKILHTSGKVGYLSLSVCSDLMHNMELL
jgi:hypothetical protein